MSKVRYFLKADAPGARWTEVAKAEFVSSERAAGFHNTWGRPSEPATGGFSGGGLRGTMRYDGSAPENDPEPVYDFVTWLASLDDPDPESQGFQDRRTVTLTQIVDRAKGVLGVS